MDITAILPAAAPATGAGVLTATAARPSEPPAAVAAPVRAAPAGPATASGVAAEQTVQAPQKATSPEEQAIRAAFQAQLRTSELLSVVRDPADLILPERPAAVT